jgi:hypothetical protein
MRIDGGGNAIFTKSGGAYLQLKDASAVRGAINVTTSDGLVFTTGSSFTERARLTSDGDLGIGTSAIMQDFGGGRTTLALKGTGTADYSTLQLGNYGTSSNGQIHGLINFYDGTTSVSRIQSVRASNTSDAHLAFYTAPSSGGITERMRILSTGGITFNGDTAQANALDDYEEGTWTPVADFNGSNIGLTYSNREGDYTKIGRLVVANIRLTLSAEGTSNGEFQVSLPFTIANIASTTSLYGGGTVPWLQGYSGAAYDVAPVPFEGSNKFRLTYRSSGTASSAYMTRTNTTNNFDIRAQVIYFTT